MFDKNVNVTTIMFLMSGDLTGLCLYMNTLLCNLAKLTRVGVHGTPSRDKELFI